MAIAPEVLSDLRLAKAAFLRYIAQRNRDSSQNGYAVALFVRLGLKHGVPAMAGLLMLLPDEAMGMAGVIKSFHVMPRADLERLVKTCAPHLDEFPIEQLRDLGRRVTDPDRDAVISFGTELFDCLD